MTRLRIFTFFISSLLLILASGLADAHKLNVFAWVKGDIVYVESKLSGGKKIKQGKFIIYDPQGNSILEGITDDEGEFSFKVPWKTTLKIVVIAGTGHKGEWTVPAEAFEESIVKPVELESIIITGRKIEERLSGELAEFGHQVEVITGEEIENAGFADLNQALEALVPGLFISVKGGRGDYAIARLHGGAQILWLLDGVRLNNRLYGSGYMDTISVKMIERIEILKGGECLFYGTDAGSGVINIITKSVSEKTSGEVDFSCGSYDYQGVSGHVGDSFYGHEVLFFGGHEGWDGYQLFSDKAHERVGNFMNKKHGFDRTTLGAKYRKVVDFLGTATLNMHLQRNKGEFDFNELQNTWAINDRVEDIAFLKWDHDINDNFSYYVKGYIHRWWTYHTRQEPDGTFVDYRSEWGYEDSGVNLMGSFRFCDGHEILLGGDYQNYWAKDDVWHIDNKREVVNALFAEYRPYISILPRTRMAVGGRYNQTDEYDKAIYHASLKTFVIGDTYIRAMAGTSFRLPTAEHLFLDEEDAKGNPHLEPEESINMDVGFGGNLSIFSWDLGYFYRKIKDRIGLVTCTAGEITWTTYENMENETEIDGFEFQAGIHPLEEISLLGSLTFVNIRDEESNNTSLSSYVLRTTRHHGVPHDDAEPGAGAASQAGQPNTETGDTPEFMAKLILAYRHASGRFGTDLSCRYIGDTYSRYTDEINYGDYFITCLSGFARFGRKSRHMITLRLDNIFNEKYALDIGRASDAETGDSFYYEYNGMPVSAVVEYTCTF